MSAFSTMYITREDAMMQITRKLSTASDEKIAEILFDLIGHETGHNFRIVVGPCPTPAGEPPAKPRSSGGGSDDDDYALFREPVDWYNRCSE